MYGNSIKSPYGYPAILNINPKLHSVGSFLCEILKEFCDSEIVNQATEIKNNYFKEIEEIFKKKK